jgi:hypothetical protein
LRNPVYISKIIIPKLNNEESYTVDGLHKPIIRPALYYDVQEVLFKSVILDVYYNEYYSTADEKKQYNGRITALNNKITKARELLLNDDIEAADFRAVKMEAEREITVLESKLSDLQGNRMSVAEVDKLS